MRGAAIGPITLSAACCLLAACAPSRVPANGPAAEAVFRSCAGSEKILAKAADLTWQPQLDAMDKHRELRMRLGSSLPASAHRVSLYAYGRHHTSSEFSVVAIRGKAGIWHVDGVGEEGPGLLQTPSRTFTPLSYDLSKEDSLRMDRLLADPCLYAAPTFRRNPAIASGGDERALQIDLPRRRWVARWMGVTTPQEDQIVKLITRS